MFNYQLLRKRMTKNEILNSIANIIISDLPSFLLTIIYFQEIIPEHSRIFQLFHLSGYHSYSISVDDEEMVKYYTNTIQRMIGRREALNVSNIYGGK